MTSSDMLDYAFGLLDEPRRVAFERNMASDPETADRMARLGSAIGLLVDGGEEIEPPSGLASRTIEMVEQRKRRPQIIDFAPSRVPFRWADLAVAATVLLAGLLTLTVPLLSSRAEMNRAACAENLHKLGASLVRYASTHGAFPYVPAGDPVGSFGVMLNEAHGLSDPSVLACPCSAKGEPNAALPDDYERFRKIIRQSPEMCQELIGRNFAYNLGYRRPSGEAVPVPASPSRVLPIASDGPRFDLDGQIHEGNSPNHGGRGQNILFSDGSVSWKRNRWISENDKDIFLNEHHLPGPGIHEADSSLGPCLMTVKAR